jgi:predicted RND superfamily exporter protein
MIEKLFLAGADVFRINMSHSDHDTMRKLVATIRQIEAEVPGLHIELGGGIIGVTAAGNQALHTDHMIIIPAVMVIAFVLVMAYYQSVHAGWLMVLPMLFSTLMTYAYMGWAQIGISVNTVPVIAVGVGVGIDYAVYFMDRIREEMARTRSIHSAVVNAVATTGSSVAFTAATLVAGVVLWIFMSDLRFQSDAAVLLSFMLIVNAVAAMFIVPAWCVVFKPHFLMETHYDADGLLQEDAIKGIERNPVSEPTHRKATVS